MVYFKKEFIYLTLLLFFIKSFAVPFKSPNSYEIPSSNLSCITKGDFNNDGYTDVIVFSEDSMYMLKNSKNGTFEDYYKGTLEDFEFLDCVTPVDFDGDGNLDIIALMYNYEYLKSIYIFLNKGDGTFKTPKRIDFSIDINDFEVVDIDRDEKIDILILSNNKLFIYKNVGNNTFKKTTREISLKTSQTLNVMKVKDINKDGFPDIVISTQEDIDIYSIDYQDIFVLINRGDSSFKSPKKYHLSINISPFAVEDINNDGYPDIVLYGDFSYFENYDYHNTNFIKMINDKNGSFVIDKEYSYSSYAAITEEKIYITDIDKDGKNDIVVYDKNLHIFKGKDNGNLEKQHIYDIPSFRFSIPIDVDKDGYPDIVTVSSNISVLKNNGKGNFIFPQKIYNPLLEEVPEKIKVDDIDKDGKKDEILYFNSQNSLNIILNKENSAYVKTYSVEPIYRMKVKDIDNDGFPDIILLNKNGTKNIISILFNKLDGSFENPQEYFESSVSQSSLANLKVKDVDKDGKLDILFIDSLTSSLYILKNKGDRKFEISDVYIFPECERPDSFDIGDLDNDGNNDFVTVCTLADSILISLNNGEGTLKNFLITAPFLSPREVVLEDLNKDGKLDISVLNGTGNSITILLNKGNAKFENPEVNYVGMFPSNLLAVDIDNDNDTDLITLNQNTYDVSILLNNGNGSFQYSLNYFADGYPNSIDATDIDNDGDIDLITPQHILINETENRIGHTKSLLVSLDGIGTVVSQPIGINVCYSNCTGSFPTDEEITLIANEIKNSKFIRWGGDCSSCGSNPKCELISDTDKICIAEFSLKESSESENSSSEKPKSSGGCSLNLGTHFNVHMWILSILLFLKRRFRKI